MTQAFNLNCRYCGYNETVQGHNAAMDAKSGHERQETCAVEVKPL